jgi:hypothetical protein
MICFAPDSFITGIALVLRHGPGEWTIQEFNDFMAQEVK